MLARLYFLRTVLEAVSKGSLISEGFPLDSNLQKRWLGTFFWDWSQSEKHSEIKLPLKSNDYHSLKDHVPEDHNQLSLKPKTQNHTMLF